MQIQKDKRWKSKENETNMQVFFPYSCFTFQ